MILLRSLTLILIISACSTPYYNLFYNAENRFEKGEERYRSMRLQAQETRQYKIQDLEIAKLKCQALLEDFGASEEETSYADDAFYLSIKASYYLGDFYSSLELIEQAYQAVPASEYLNDMKLFKVLNQFDLGNILQAEEGLIEVEELRLSGFNLLDYYVVLSKIAKSKEQIVEAQEYLKLAIHASEKIPDDDSNKLKQRAFLIEQYFTTFWQLEEYKEIVANNSLLFAINDQDVILDYYPMVVLAYSKLHTSPDSVKSFLTKNEEMYSLVSEDLHAFSLQYSSITQQDSTQFFTAALAINESFSDSKIRGLFVYNMALYFDFTLNQVDTASLLYKDASQKLRIGWLKSEVISRKLYLDGLKRHLLAQETFENSIDTVAVLSIAQTLQRNQLIFDKAVFLYQQKKYNDALNQFSVLSEDTTSNDLRISAFFHIASIYELTDRKADALKLYERLLEEDLSLETHRLIKEKLNLSTEDLKPQDSPLLSELKPMITDSLASYADMLILINNYTLDSLSQEFKTVQFFLFAKRVKQIATRDTVFFDEILNYLKKQKDPQVNAYFAKYDFNYTGLNYAEDDEDGDSKSFNKPIRGKNIRRDDISTEPKNLTTPLHLLSKLPNKFYYPVEFTIGLELSISGKGSVESYTYLDEELAPSLDIKEKIEVFVKKLKFNEALRRVNEQHTLNVYFSPESENQIEDFNGEIRLEK